jgi:hypothetical protein
VSIFQELAWLSSGRVQPVCNKTQYAAPAPLRAVAEPSFIRALAPVRPDGQAASFYLRAVPATSIQLAGDATVWSFSAASSPSTGSAARSLTLTLSQVLAVGEGPICTFFPVSHVLPAPSCHMLFSHRCH